MPTPSSRAFAPSPALLGAAYYWFFWSMVAFYAPFFNVYLTELGLTATQLGIVAAIFPLFALLAAPLLSSLADRRGWRRPLLRLGLVGWAVILLFYPLAAGFWGIFLLVLLEAAIRSPTAPISDSLIARMASRHHLNYGSMRLWGSLGFASVAIGGGLLWQRWGYRPMFATAAVAALPVLFLLRYMEPAGATAHAPTHSPRVLARDPGLLALYAGAVLLGMALYGTFVFGGVYIVGLGGNETHVGLFFGLSALAEVPVMRASDHLMQRLRGVNALLLAYVAVAVALLGFALAWSPLTLLLANTLKGVGYGLFFVVTVRLIDERAPEMWSATAQALFSACVVGLAPLLSTTVSGVVYERWGPEALFAGLTAVCGLAVALLLLARQRGWFALEHIYREEK